MIILNERTKAEEILYDKDLGNKPFFALTMLAKYYYHCFGYRKKKITELLIDFMQRYYPRYSVNISAWNDNIERIAKNAGKYRLYENDGVWITDKELETIQNIHGKVLERLAFTSLCIAKLNHLRNPENQGWVNTDEKELFKLANITCKAKERSVYIGRLGDLGLIEFPKRNENMSFLVTFIQDGNNTLFVPNFGELGYEYRKYCGEDFVRCAQCGKLTPNNKYGNKKYCSDCASYRPISYKTITCVDCGKEVVINSLNNRTVRCKECQLHKDKERKRIWKESNKNDKKNLI